MDIFERQVPVELGFDQVKKIGLNAHGQESPDTDQAPDPRRARPMTPPVGPALGQHGVNIMEFCKAFAQTQQENGGSSRSRSRSARTGSFDFITKTPPAAVRDQGSAEDREGLGGTRTARRSGG